MACALPDPWTLDESCKDAVRTRHVIRGIPSSAIARKSVVMGTVWIFKPTEKYSFQQLCVSRMVERFGRDEANWEQVELDFLTFEVGRSSLLAKRNRVLKWRKSFRSKTG